MLEQSRITSKSITYEGDGLTLQVRPHVMRARVAILIKDHHRIRWDWK